MSEPAASYGVRRILAIAAIAAMALLRVDPSFLMLPFMDRRPLEEAFVHFPDSTATPEYPRFLAHVRATTPRGATIAIAAPTLDWDAGYSYAYYRASYFLTGRTVLPLALPHRELLPRNFFSAEYVAAWHAPVPQGRSAVVWKGDGGVLLRRIR